MNPENTEYPEYNFEGFENNDEDDEGLSTAMSEVERHSLRNQMAGIHEAESLNYLESLRSPQSADDLLEMINQCAFLEGTKEALRGLTRIRISTDKLLTNTQNIERAKLNFEAALLEYLVEEGGKYRLSLSRVGVIRFQGKIFLHHLT